MSDVRTVVFSKQHTVRFEDKAVPDIDVDADFLELFKVARGYTMTSKDAMYALYCAVNYVLEREIPGDFVECGVWRGGSSLLAALVLKRRREAGRRLFLYDTFEGMPPPTALDVDKDGVSAAEHIEAKADDEGWCYASLEDVKATFDAHDFGFETTYVKGDVVETLQATKPKDIALLRLDTDWYESTMAELTNLYPRLRPGGVLIIDDYGHWEGARRATDEYFKTVPAPLLVRVNYSVRLAIKL